MLAIIRRGLAAAFLTLALSACQIIPGGAPEPTAPPPPVVAGPDESVLPEDAERHRVALLVPLSGSSEAAGRSIANAATMALLDTSAENLRITTYDTATGAGSAAARAIADGNALILGPLLRDDVNAVLGQARPAGVPLITFSNDSSVAEQDVFVMGHVPEQSISRTVAYALGQGARRFAALVPNGEYGTRTADALGRAVREGGGSVVATERYDRGNTSIISAAERIKAAGGFDTVLIADGARLSVMAGGPLAEGERPNMIGTELWSGEESVANAAALRGAWFAAVSDDRYRQFVDSYQGRFGEQPFRIATLGYDAVLLTLRIARDWQPGTAFPTQAMAASDGFLGLDGPFRFHGNGMGERAMEVRQVDNGSISVVDPAPQRFN